MTTKATLAGQGEIATFGQWLKARREALGFTIRDVERICEGRVSNAAVWQIETGKIKNPSARLLGQLAAAYGLDEIEVWSRARDESPLPPTPTICPTCGQATNPYIRR